MMSNRIFVLTDCQGSIITRERVNSNQIVYVNGLLIDGLVKAIDIALNAHRKNSFLTCPENCWCWDLETQTMKTQERIREINKEGV